MGKVALKTIEGICKLYQVHQYIDYGERIAIYNAVQDNFHVFQWSWERARYIWAGAEDTMPQWTERIIRI